MRENKFFRDRHFFSFNVQDSMKFPYYRKFIQFESQQVVDGVMLNNYVTDIQHNSKLINYNETQSSVTIGG